MSRNQTVLFIFSAMLSIACLLYTVFAFFPTLGHDYSYFVPNSLEFFIAWNKHGILNPKYSPMRCLGLPMWANPSSHNLSFLHFFSLFARPLYAIALYNSTITLISLCGAFLFTRLFTKNFFISLCFSVGWALQAHIVTSAIVGHLNHMTIGFFPFLFYLLLKKQEKYSLEILSVLGLVLLFSQIVFTGAQYEPFIWTISFVVTIITLYFFKFDFKNHYINLKYILLRNAIAIIISILLVLPKVLAVSKWMANYPRHQTFLNVGILNVLEYSFYNLIIPTPFDAKSSVGWWYGNWESNQSLLPMMTLFLFGLLYLKKEYVDLRKLGVFIVSIFCLSVFINSGIYADLCSKLPILNSLHVNPRWNTIILLPTFSGLIFLASKYSLKIKNSVWIIFALLFLFYPLLYINKLQNDVSYVYLSSYSPELNRLHYCYEPIFGYRLENFPKSGFDMDLFGKQLIDPRCYLKNSTCTPGDIINNDDKILLDEYKLK